MADVNFYKVESGLWDVNKACFTKEYVKSEHVVELMKNGKLVDNEYLRRTLEFYGHTIGHELMSLNEVKASSLEKLNACFVSAEAAGKIMSSAGFVIDATERSNRDIEGLITSMEATGAPEAAFCAADNSFHTVTLEQLRAMRLEVIAYGQALYARKWELRTAIEAAETVDAVQAVDIIFDGVGA